MTDHSQCILGIAISLALHVAAFWLWQPEFLHAEKVHMAGEIELLSIVEESSKQPEAPPPKATERPHMMPKSRVVKKKTATVITPVAMREAPTAPVKRTEELRRPLAETVSPSIIASPPAPEVAKKAVVLSHGELTRLYASQVRQRIEAFKTYPRRAQRAHMEGAIRVRFVLSPGGDVKRITIVRGSRFAALNTAAKKAVLSAAPFPSLPEHMAKTPISLEVTLCFELT